MIRRIDIEGERSPLSFDLLHDTLFSFDLIFIKVSFSYLINTPEICFKFTCRPESPLWQFICCSVMCCLSTTLSLFNVILFLILTISMDKDNFKEDIPFYPLGGGPRYCICGHTETPVVFLWITKFSILSGGRLGYLMMRTALCTLIHKFEFEAIR